MRCFSRKPPLIRQVGSDEFGERFFRQYLACAHLVAKLAYVAYALFLTRLPVAILESQLWG